VTTAYRIYLALRRWIAPELKYSQYFYEDALFRHVAAGAAWLDLGCGHQLLPEWSAEREAELVRRPRLLAGVDYDLDSLRRNRAIALPVRGQLERLPFKGAAFDLATANMVLEHVADPDRQFREVARVLREDGTFLFHTPNTAGYVTLLGRLVPKGQRARVVRLLGGRAEEDVFETHYRANDVAVIERLAASSGFELVSVRHIVSDAVFQNIPPIAAVELLWLRLLMAKPLKRIRTNLLVTLRKVRLSDERAPTNSA
jgi:ubiquinone/menaquinone biosynthesis C-methylase UbiE